jgi:hypothetical protein
MLGSGHSVAQGALLSTARLLAHPTDFPAVCCYRAGQHSRWRPIHPRIDAVGVRTTGDQVKPKVERNLSSIGGQNESLVNVESQTAAPKN